MESRSECGCATLGKKRVLKREDILHYRGWGYLQFMCSFQGSVLPELWKWALSYAAVAAAWKGVYEFTQESERWSHVDLSTHQLLSVPIAFLIVFRANVAHDRFWEGKMHLERFYGSLRVIAQKTLVRCLLIQLATQLLARLVQHATGSLSAASLTSCCRI